MPEIYNSWPSLHDHDKSLRLSLQAGSLSPAQRRFAAFWSGHRFGGRFPVQFNGICGLGIETLRKKAVEGASWDPALVEGTVFTPA